MNIGWQKTIDETIGHNFINESNEIFKSGKWAFLARELIQNSNDALSDNQTKLVMKMTLDDVNINEFPFKEGILEHINGTLSIQDLPDRCKDFNENAKKILESDTIRVLKVSDYNTDGVVGSEKPNSVISSPWNALIYDEGNSQKSSENSTGSFGTGKNAPFALSGLNTVFYVTKDKNDYFAVEGVAKLYTSYINEIKYHKKLYFGKIDNNELRPLDKADVENYLSKLFKREETGSDVIIFGVDFDKAQMKKEIIQSVVENFFVLLSDDKLDITVFDEQINSKTIWQIIDKYCDKPIEYTNSNIKYGHIRNYLSVYNGNYEIKEFVEDVTGAGKLRLIISKGNDINGKWVAMFRNKGMKIFDSNIRTAQQNYSAIFFPGDDDVDKFLKEIENPTHDFFDPEMRISDKDKKIQAIKRYEQIQNWIRKKVEDYTKINISDNDFLEGMEEYLQLEDVDNESKVVEMPEVEIVNYENKTNTTSPMVESDTVDGDEGISDFTPEDGSSNNKNDFSGGNTENPGTGKNGLIKDIHNSFKLEPKISAIQDEMKIALSLDNYGNEKFNIEILTIGEDNSVSNYVPKIVSAKEMNTNSELEIVGNKIINIPTCRTNLITLKFDRNFNSRYKIDVYKERGENNEG